MKFPITRESLQAFYPEKENEEMRESAIERKVNEFIGSISSKLRQSISNYHESMRACGFSEENHIITQKKILTEKRYTHEINSLANNIFNRPKTT